MSTMLSDGRRRQLLRVSLGIGASVAVPFESRSAPAAERGPSTAAPPGVLPALQWQERNLLGFGTTLSLRAGHRNAQQLSAALLAAIAEIRAIEQLMSLFDADSAVCRLNTDGVLRQPDFRLLDVLTLARRVSKRSDGAFDVTMQPLWQVWQNAAKQDRLPTTAQLASARAKVDWRKLEFDATAIRLRAPGMAVSLNGIAQGYAADRARAALLQHGVEHALLDTGEWAPLGQADDGARWQLGVANPHQRDALMATLATDGRCVATSSDDRTVFSTDRVHHHIIDPRLGQSPKLLSSVTVVADSGALADALTKVFFMAETQLGLLPPIAASAILAPRDQQFDARLARVAGAIAMTWQVDALLVDKHGAWWATPGLRIKAT